MTFLDIRIKSHHVSSIASYYDSKSNYFVVKLAIGAKAVDGIWLSFVKLRLPRLRNLKSGPIQFRNLKIQKKS